MPDKSSKTLPFSTLDRRDSAIAGDRFFWLLEGLRRIESELTIEHVGDSTFGLGVVNLNPVVAPKRPLKGHYLE